ncbi:MAG TPA: hypothetical protein VHE34_05115 [Puia sp.]|uniref:hypothetical protein n=1 Tax=Puia sp. TaxID=2045100 RepID=UPI002C1A80FA|nr:hypothetical protein [Puia sp.]HVU94580.1 hypothetical protein [Puia sp.]
MIEGHGDDGWQYATALRADFSSNVYYGGLDTGLREHLRGMIEYVHFRSRRKRTPFDSVSGVFIEGKPLYPTAGFYDKSHIQICVCNPNCIKGFFIPRAVDKKWPVP